MKITYLFILKYNQLKHGNLEAKVKLGSINHPKKVDILVAHKAF